MLFGQYWAHRLTHQVPLLWRFHSVHHSIEDMDWLASARVHPVDQVFTHGMVVVPLFLLGYNAGVFGGVVVFFTLLALFQHANVRLRFPVVRWVINTPVWSLAPHARPDQQELRDAGDRQAVRHRPHAAPRVPVGVRDLRAGPSGRVRPPARLPVHEGGPDRVGSAAGGAVTGHGSRVGAVAPWTTSWTRRHSTSSRVSGPTAPTAQNSVPWSSTQLVMAPSSPGWNVGGSSPRVMAAW